MRRGKVLITGNFSFPKKNAAGKRVLGIGYILKELGYEVVFVGCDRNRTENTIQETKKIYEGFTYYNYSRARGILNILNVSKAYKEFKSVIQDNGGNFSIVILYGSPVLSIWINRVIKYCKNKDILTIFDCVDWIEKSGNNNAIKNAVKYIDTNYMKRYLACKCDGVICVSRFLRDYYKRKNKRTVIIPPVGKLDNPRISLDNPINDNVSFINNSVVKFIYAGSIPLHKNINTNSLKDRIDITIELMYRLLKNGIDFKFDVYGIEKAEYIEAIPAHINLINALGNKLYFHGKVDNDKVCEKIREADFMILNRTISKVTTAGFPSKIAESLLLGTPVITNDTSDIKYYLDNNNGYIISFDIDEAEKQLQQLCVNRYLIHAMREKCIKGCCFDYKLYNIKIKKFIEELRIH